nr:hypothetical protein Iba_chr09dCG12080 [Ipomoea batatas]GME21754.1 hypothetical protein Iba_scaffold29088CG0010 [Ipomoea batatas]
MQNGVVGSANRSVHSFILCLLFVHSAAQEPLHKVEREANDITKRNRKQYHEDKFAKQFAKKQSRDGRGKSRRNKAIREEENGKSRIEQRLTTQQRLENE